MVSKRGLGVLDDGAMSFKSRRKVACFSDDVGLGAVIVAELVSALSVVVESVVAKCSVVFGGFDDT